MGKRESVSRSDRTGLPEEVVPGRDYRDSTVVYRLDTRLTGDTDGDDGDDRDADGDADRGDAD
ncbi:hypothetical protein [Streptomyces tagetis]|uniref:hypothetical protein n=1 Tax=Streptomyces tagetis TaxID=2820809 RepID=UPI001FF81D4E|nr:hypothetical protein [Streptomyces sp. RG38]